MRELYMERGGERREERRRRRRRRGRSLRGVVQLD